VEQTGTTPADTSPQAQVDENQSTPSADEVDGASSQPPGFQSRGRARRRARFLRKARELAYRDLGGLVFNLHRFGQRNDALVLAKLTTLDQIDTELRSIEASVGERRPITVLREAGITACPRCAAIHSSEDNFCPNCGMSMGRHADLPIAGAATPAPQPTSAPQPTPASQPTLPPQPTPAGAPPAAATPPPAGAPRPMPAAASATPSAQPTTPVPDAVGPAQPEPSAPAQAHEPVPATPPGGRSPSPPSTDRPTEIIRPPASGS